MVSATVYLEGGGDSKEGKIRCREGFRRLFENCGLAGRMPKLVACGGRDSAYGKFKTKHANSSGSAYIGLLIDSEDPLGDIDRAWAHLAKRDGWQRPPGASDCQVLFMTVCMETWIVADRDALRQHYGQHLQESALPRHEGLEDRSRSDIQKALVHATRDCLEPYAKGPKAFQILGKLDPEVIEDLLPSFRRARHTLVTYL